MSRYTATEAFYTNGSVMVNAFVESMISQFIWDCSEGSRPRSYNSPTDITNLNQLFDGYEAIKGWNDDYFYFELKINHFTEIGHAQDIPNRILPLVIKYTSDGKPLEYLKRAFGGVMDKVIALFDQQKFYNANRDRYQEYMLLASRDAGVITPEEHQKLLEVIPRNMMSLLKK